MVLWFLSANCGDTSDACLEKSKDKKEGGASLRHGHVENPSRAKVKKKLTAAGFLYSILSPRWA